MSTLKADTIVASDGSSPVTLTKQQATKAWVNLNGTGTIAARDSFNQSSLTDNGQGDYTVSFTSSLSNSDFCFNATTSGDSGNFGYTVPKGQSNNEFVYASGSLRLGAGFASDVNSTAASRDPHQFNISVHGDLA